MRIHGIGKVNEIYKTQAAKIQSDKVIKKDAVEFSTMAKDYQCASKAIKDVPDVRRNQVESIKERISTGTYNIDAREISEKIVNQFDMKG